VRGQAKLPGAGREPGRTLTGNVNHLADNLTTSGLCQANAEVVGHNRSEYQGAP
jgi:hypothetical protein